MFRKATQAATGNEGYSIAKGPRPDWLDDPKLLPRKSVAQILRETDREPTPKPKRRRAR